MGEWDIASLVQRKGAQARRLVSAIVDDRRSRFRYKYTNAINAAGAVVDA